MAKKTVKKEKTGIIKQGSVAEFFRKRTQLVGFDFGLNKHTQYAIEFLDNSLDAIESFQWKEKKKHKDYAFSLDLDIILENFSYTNPVSEEEILKMEKKIEAELVDDEGNPLDDNGALLLPSEGELADETLILEEEKSVGDNSKEKEKLENDEEAKKLRKLRKKKKELEDEVQTIMYGIDGFLYSIRPMVEREPFVIYQLTERDAKDVYVDATKEHKEVYEYRLDVYDNGTGMSPGDLSKFGKYLASSKSKKLKQTRGSQGFGAPSAFSDAQNTTGQPVTVVSKTMNHLYAICSQFYTTSKNNKEYIVPPTEVTSCFEHGTYVSLNYINTKYRKGYVDSYIQQTALTNPHITIIYLDPNGDEQIYPRRVERFPREPTYALPHPTSVNIGDFQDNLRSSENYTISSFLQDNYVRLSSTIAKKIVSQAKENLEEKLSIIDLSNGYIDWATNKSQSSIHFMRFEKRVYGRSKKKREKLIVYNIKSGELKFYWEKIDEINKVFKIINSMIKKIRKLKKSLSNLSTKKARRKRKKNIKSIRVDLKKKRKDFRKDIDKLSKSVETFTLSSSNEVKDVKILDRSEDLIKELLISKAKPSSLTQNQTESLFKSFKSQKYLSPPSDPAVPIGASILETTLFKEFNLNPSHRTDLFIDYYNKLDKFNEREEKIFPKRILAIFLKYPYFEQGFSSNDIIRNFDGLIQDNYKELFLKFDAQHIYQEDFVFGATRKPTSGKGLAFVVEAAIAISPKIPLSGRASDILMRYVNRTPKTRDNADCAIWRSCCRVNWKNYKLDTFDNGIPKGHIRILINVSGPYVHLMFKSQSKNSLAEDEVLMNEIKLCLESIGRKIRRFVNKKKARENRRKRSSVIEKFIPLFVGSLMGIAGKIENYKDIKPETLEKQIKDRLHGKIKKTKEEIETEKEKELAQEKAKELIKEHKRELKEESKKKETKQKEEPKKIDSKVKIKDKADITKKKKLKPKELQSKSQKIPKSVRSIDDILKAKVKPHTKKKVKSKKSYDSANKVKTKQKRLDSSKPVLKVRGKKKVSEIKKSKTTVKKQKKLIKPKNKVKIISTSKILTSFPSGKWMNIKDLIKLFKITDLKDARYLQLKLKQLTQTKKLLISIKSGKTFWKLKE